MEWRPLFPIEVGLPTLRSAQLEARGNDAAIEEALDFTETRREVDLIKLVNYQQAISKQRQSHINSRDDLVLRKTLGTVVEPRHGKLGQN